MYFRYFAIISLWKNARSFIWIPLIQMAKLVEISPVVLEKKKLWKVYDSDEDYEDNNDDDKQRTNCDQ